jgi:hypothetical protein
MGAQTLHDDGIAPDLVPEIEDATTERSRMRTLGNVRLRHHETSELILIPAPSADPNDPLNWYAAPSTSAAVLQMS